MKKSNVFYRFLTLAIACMFLSIAGTADAREYIGPEPCKGCHADYYEAFAKTKMGRLFINNPQDELQARVCETCHGPGSDHVASWEEVDELDLTTIISFKKHSLNSVAERNEMCLHCHEGDYNRTSWVGSTHESQNVSCADCHRVMNKISDDKSLIKERQMDVCFQCHQQKKAQLQRNSHMPIREGKLVCADCHNPHGGQGPTLLKEANVNNTCYQCHQEKRGPLVWEHAPVRENCANCHEPHGSNYPNLLKVKSNFLCQSCHASALHASELYDGSRLADGTAPSGRIIGKFCTSCHSKIHGSNHPSGARFQR
ncbi:MAG: DmsE family decaheme c-type cytochrome [Nitrospinota bacterium]|nr:DmsE family decaheme c-type cytochrome [Nitrospinota bacterium]